MSREAEYLYTDREGTAVHAGDTVKTYHNAWSKDDYLIGTMVSRGEVEACPCGADHLTIDVTSEVRHGLAPRSVTPYQVFPACVEPHLGGAVLLKVA